MCYEGDNHKVDGSIPTQTSLLHPWIGLRCFTLINIHQSAAWPSGSERRFYDDHDRKVSGSTPTTASLLHPWI